MSRVPGGVAEEEEVQVEVTRLLVDADCIAFVLCINHLMSPNADAAGAGRGDERCRCRWRQRGCWWIPVVLSITSLCVTTAES